MLTPVKQRLPATAYIALSLPLLVGMLVLIKTRELYTCGVPLLGWLGGSTGIVAQASRRPVLRLRLERPSAHAKRNDSS